MVADDRFHALLTRIPQPADNQLAVATVPGGSPQVPILILGEWPDSKIAGIFTI